MKIQLVDLNGRLCEWWNNYFGGCTDVTVHNCDLFSVGTDCVVSPANSFGFMDGSLDLVISERLGWGVQAKLQDVIRTTYHGEILVGQAELVETGDVNIPYCISAPTMRVPMVIYDTVNVYLACKAIFLLLKTMDIGTVTIPGMGTGVGQLPPDVCAMQMRKAYDDYWLGNYRFPVTLVDASINHEYLY